MKRTIVVIAIFLLAACSADDPPAGNEVRIVRDEYGVPHVYADTVYGLYYGYGYSIAQDRLFQLEMARRSTLGTVSEVLGIDYIDYDKNARTLFDPASISRQLNALEPKDKDVLEGYAAGINAWLAQIRGEPATLTPKQFVDLDFFASDWTAYDIAMIFIGTMNNRYGDYNTELENAAILATLTELHGEKTGLDYFDLLNPRFTDNAPTTIPRADWSRPAYDSLAESSALNLPQTRLRLARAGPTISGFSNCYVIGPSKLDGASSILVNGPQFGWFNPSYVYSIGMHGAGVDVVGNTPFGYPMIMFGHNKTITWGSTWGASDIVDIFAEQLSPEDPGQYLHNGEFVDFVHRTETIAVKGGEAVKHEVLRSVHGPVIRTDIDAGVAYAKRRSWDGGELDNLLAWLYATWAEDWEEWRAEAIKASINVNMYFADVDGNIGYFHGGHFPRRAPGHDNRFPVTGDGSMDWQGRQPADTANPHVLNPSTGFLANWNNKPGHGVMNPDFFFYGWSSADRVLNLHDALNARDTFTPDEAWDIIESSSHADLYARYFLPVIEEAVSDSDDVVLQQANRLLQSWDRKSTDDNGDGYYDDAATGLFRSFVSALIERSLSDDLGDAFPFFAASGYPTKDVPTGAGTNLPPGVKAIVEALEGGSAVDIFNGATPASVIRAALNDAIGQQELPGLEVAPRPFSFENFLGIPQAGEDESLLAPFEQNRGTENNMIIMRPDAIEGWEVTPPGQSAFVGPDGEKSGHYDDQFEMYQSFGRKRMWFYPDDVEAAKQSDTIIRF